MPILSTVILSSTPQQNGTLLVHEQHTDSDGTLYDHVYFALADADIVLAAQLRGQVMGEEIDKRKAAKLEALNFEIPLSDIEIMRRLSPVEWQSFQTSTDPTIEYFRAIFAKAKTVYRTDPLTQAGFAALIAAGVLTQARVDEVLA